MNELNTPLDPLTVLAEEVAELRDLFRRRLLEDKSKSALIETVQKQAEAVTDALRHRQFESLFREALLAVDRLQAEPASPELIGSVIDELLDVFGRRSLVAIDDSGAFDPSVHHIVGTVLATEQLPVDSIAAVERMGYLLDGRLLRPSQVIVAVRADDVIA
ncbi:MAG TPA: nucleotide exchange factor GrpE [Pseudolysinimonas sp.]|jgi:molecular chaperone GrpE